MPQGALSTYTSLPVPRVGAVARSVGVSMALEPYRIIDWDRHFENSESRKLKRLDWLKIPVKLDGWAYAHLIDHKDGPAHFGCWVALLELAASCRPRGALNRPTGEPMTLHDISRQTRIAMPILEAAITRMVSIGWVASPGNLPESPDVPGDCRGNPPPRVEEMERRERGEERTRSSAGADVRLVVRIWNENRGPLPEVKTIAKDRLKLVRLLAADSGLEEALLASAVAAFASDPYNREQRYGIDTLCRHRSKWLDHGRNGYAPPSNGHGSLLDGWTPPPDRPGTEHD